MPTSHALRLLMFFRLSSSATPIAVHCSCRHAAPRATPPRLRRDDAMLITPPLRRYYAFHGFR